MEVAVAIIGLLKDTLAVFGGIFIVWLALAATISSIQNWIATSFRFREKFLEENIEQLLGSKELKNKVYNHPLIKGLHTDKGRRKPGGIPEDKLALVLFEEVMNSGVTVIEVKNDFDKLKQSVEALKASSEGNEGLKNFATALDTLLIGVEEKVNDAAHAITEARVRVEGWYNDSLERTSDAYRRHMQVVALVSGILLTTALNIDTLAIANALWNNSVVREAIAKQAIQLSESSTQSSQPPSIEEITQSVDKLDNFFLPIGWSKKNMPSGIDGWPSKIIGILISSLAGAQGAPYFFDFMRKLLTRNQPVPQQPA